MPLYKHLSAQDACSLMERPNCQVVDIRDPESYNRGHIANARLLNNDNLVTFLAATDKQSPTIVCCYHGNSSQGAAQYFAEQGFTEVYSLDGGFEQWRTSFPDKCSQ